MYQICRFGISPEDAAALVRGAAMGEYSLLLGAGFSLGAKNAQGHRLPTSMALASALKDEFALSLEIEGPASLPLAYEDAVHKAGEHQVFKYLRRTLTGCTPSWHRMIASIDWQRVWTLNIDDLLRAVFSDKLIRELSFKDPYRVKNDRDGLQLIYLHGRAEKLDGKVFSIQEYHDAVRAPGDWHTAFFTEFKERPFIVCGASLVGEVDFARTLRAKNESRLTFGTPSLAVIKGMSSAASERLNDRLGLLPIDASGEDFFQALAADVGEFVSANPALLPSSVNPNLARVFGQQFQLLTADQPGKSPPRQDYYAGDEPLWSDIAAGRDAVLSHAKNVVKEIRQRIDSGVVVAGIFGDAGCGKTSTLLRVGRELSPLPVYLFQGFDDIDIDACLACSSRRATVLLFDDAADISSSIGDLARLAEERGLKLGLVFAERTKRRKGILSSALTNESVVEIDHSTITPGDAIAVAEQRRAAKRLGSFGGQSNSELRKLFIEKHHGNLLSALTEIDLGRGFDARLGELAAAINMNGSLGELVLAVAQTHRWGYPLPIHFATGATGIPSDVIVNHCVDGGLLADVMFIERRGIRFRHRVLAERVFETKGGGGVSASVAQSLVRAIAPLLNIEAIRNKSYAFRICRVLMERRSVYSLLGGRIDAARQWYAELEPDIGWNSRYWEQRALLELEAHNYSAAYSFAKAAADKESHAFPLTTLGTTCLTIAGHRSSTSLAEAFDFYKEGESALKQAVVVGRKQPDTLLRPVVTYFSHAERLWPVFQGNPAMRKRLQDDWAEWIDNARKVGYFAAHPEVEPEIRGWLLRSAIQQ